MFVLPPNLDTQFLVESLARVESKKDYNLPWLL